MATLQMTEKQTSTAQIPLHEPRASQAMASDPGKALRLAPSLQPDVDLLTTEGLIAFGVKGSGKSNLLALLVEQLRRFLLPQIILDSEREHQGVVNLLPHGVIASASRCPSGYDIIHKGLQVILDLQSWDTDEAAALAMCQLIGELFATTTAQAPQERVPCVIHLDEAGYWLPQEAVSYLSKETRKALADAFHKLASRGRKQGLTPFLYTQSISEVAKSAIRQAGVKVLMRQTLDVDLTRYCQYIQGATARSKKAIQAYPSGKAVVILPDGSQHRVQFHQRESEHKGHTPQAQAALVKFAALHIDVSALPMREMAAQASAPVEQAARPGKGKQAPTARTVTEHLSDLLAVDPSLRAVDLTRLTGCSEGLASRAHRVYFEKHPHLAPVHHTTATERISELLAENPTLRPVELMQAAQCSKTTASRARLAYFAAHPEQQAHPTEKPRPTITHKAPRPPLSQEARRRLEEAQGRLIEQGLPVTYEWLAREAHIGYHAIATFLQERRGTSQSEAEQARVQERPTVL